MTHGLSLNPVTVYSPEMAEKQRKLSASSDNCQNTNPVAGQQITAIHDSRPQTAGTEGLTVLPEESPRGLRMASAKNNIRRGR